MSEASEGFQHLVGSTLAERYRINALLGVGGMGAVFDAEHLLMHKRVAIKLLLPEYSQTGEIVARFEREAMAAANIDHPNVVAATDFGKLPDGSFYLVLEFIEGRNLRQALLDETLSPERALHILEQIASVLIKAHALGIVHRDLKPENVMLVQKDDDADFVKVLDFGIAKVPVEALSGQQIQTDQGLTRLGVMYGTPEYMAPEQAMGVGVDYRADLYALGVILFEMVTGVRPFDSENVVSLVTMHIIEPPPKLKDRLPQGVAIPEGLEELVAQLLEKERDHRLQSARELIDRIRAILGIAPLSQVPPSSLQAAALQQPPTSLTVGAISQGTLTADGFRWRQGWHHRISELQHFRDRLPAPFSKLPLAVFPSGFGLLLLVLIVGIAWPRSRTPISPPPAVATTTKVVTLSEEELKGAQAGGIPSLEALQERFPEDARITRALLAAYQDAGRSSDALQTLRKLTKQVKPEEKLLSDDLVLATIKAALGGSPEVFEEVFSLLETGFGADGIDFLYNIWTAKKDANEKARKRAEKSLRTPEIKERATKATRTLIDLRVVPASCELRRAAVVLAQEAGDQRAVPLMQQLTSKKGCGFMGFQDCWACLRRDNLLGEAIKAAKERPPP